MLGAPGTKVPRVTGKNLNGRTVRFPEDIRGRPALMLIAFRRYQQQDVDTWLGRMDDLRRVIPDLQVLELPVLRTSHLLVRSLIDGGMRNGIPDPEARARTITFYLDKKSFRKAFGLGPEDRIFAVLADREAAILDVQEGPATDERVDAIIKAHFGPRGDGEISSLLLTERAGT
jgi:hypothetical protein